MRLNTMIKAQYVAEYWVYTSFQNSTTGQLEKTYVYSKDVAVVITPSTTQQNALSVFSTLPLIFQAQLRNLKDKNGKPLFSDDGSIPLPATVGAGQPSLNVYGIIEGYRYALTRGVANG